MTLSIIAAINKNIELTTLLEFSKLESQINYQFKNRHLLLEAITHNSFLNEFRELDLKNYERLEFVGDALVGLMVARELFEKYPKESEGALSKMRASIVHEKPLSEISAFLKLDEFILLGKGELRSLAYKLPSLRANIFESIIGAIYVDSNEESAKKVFWELISRYQHELGVELLSLQNLQDFDPKTRLQELTMSLYKTLPRYEIKQLRGDLFSVELLINNRSITAVESTSKKRGEESVARKAIEEKLYLSESLGE